MKYAAAVSALLWGSVLSAQAAPDSARPNPPKRRATMHAFASQRAHDKTELATWIERRSPVLNVQIGEFVHHVNERFGLRLENGRDLASWIMTLDEAPCRLATLPANGKINLLRVNDRGKIDTVGWVRSLHKDIRGRDEMCLVNNKGQVVLSLWCSNLIKNLMMAVVPPAKKEEVVAAGPTPRPAAVTVAVDTTEEIPDWEPEPEKAEPYRPSWWVKHRKGFWWTTAGVVTTASAVAFGPGIIRSLRGGREINITQHTCVGPQCL